VILVDTSVWIDHLRAGDRQLAELLETRQVLSHPFVVGELALGNLRQRRLIVDSLQNLPRASVATDREVLALIERQALYGKGIGYVDSHLLASALLTTGTSIWTRDQRLRHVATRLRLAVGELR
jgi:predicted nucleic acid-binding protein